MKRLLLLLLLPILFSGDLYSQVDPGTTTVLTTPKSRNPTTRYRLSDIRFIYYPEAVRVTVQMFDNNGVQTGGFTKEYSGPDFPTALAASLKTQAINLLKRDNDID